MTNELSVEEAVELLKEKRMEINYRVNGTTQFSEALDLAIKALEQQPCEKCVSIADLLELLKGIELLHNHDELRSNLIYGIMNLPSVTPQPQTGRIEYGTDGTPYKLTISNGKEFEQQPKTGHWIDVETLDSALWHECSECGETEFYATDYCPNCGAKMEVEV